MQQLMGPTYRYGRGFASGSNGIFRARDKMLFKLLPRLKALSSAIVSRVLLRLSGNDSSYETLSHIASKQKRQEETDLPLWPTLTP